MTLPPSTPKLVLLFAQTTKLARASIAPSTQRVYESVLRKPRQWLTEYQTLLDNRTLATYLAELLDQKRVLADWKQRRQQPIHENFLESWKGMDIWISTGLNRFDRVNSLKSVHRTARYYNEQSWYLSDSSTSIENRSEKEGARLRVLVKRVCDCYS